ncbi:hypothetical protein NYA22BAC_01885 [Parasphingorhabdus sp. NYA22]
MYTQPTGSKLTFLKIEQQRALNRCNRPNVRHSGELDYMSASGPTSDIAAGFFIPQQLTLFMAIPAKEKNSGTSQFEPAAQTRTASPVRNCLGQQSLTG